MSFTLGHLTEIIELKSESVFPPLRPEGSALIKGLTVFIFTLLFITPLSASDKPFIISGFDDVLRQAENTSLLRAALKILEGDKTFSGMPELYQTISRDEVAVDKFTLVSAISVWFDDRIRKFLLQSKYPSSHRYLKNWLTEWSIEDFKVTKIKEIIKVKPNRQFIVVFDNSEASLKLVETLRAEFSRNISAIYLRQVVNKDVPKGGTAFFTAFDIALNEFKSQRLNMTEVISIGNVVATEKISENIIPSYAFCHTDYNPCLELAPDLIEICVKVKKRINEICNRGS